MALKKEETKPRLRMKLRAYDHKVIDNGAKQIVAIVLRHGGDAIGPIPLPTEIKKFTVNRSTFVHKDAREQFEMRIHKRMIDIVGPDKKVVEAMRDINLPAGVDIEVKMQ